MKTNGTNPGINVDEYENMAVEKSSTAKRVFATGAAMLGASAVSSAATYHVTRPAPTPVVDDITVDDVIDGADVATTYQEEVHKSDTKVVNVSKEPKAHEPNVVWDKSESVYLNGERISTVESGTVDGHKFELRDNDGDGIADELRADEDGNGEFDENEITTLTAADNIKMGHQVAHSERHDVVVFGEFGSETGEEVAQDENIHNDWEEEKTGESYDNDYAENNSDYTPDADTGYYTASVDEEYIQNDDVTDFGGDEFLG